MRKAAGVNEIKAFGDYVICIFRQLFNKIYVTGHLLKELLTSMFRRTPKKNASKLCFDYRPISLMSHALKMFLKIIQKNATKT